MGPERSQLELGERILTARRRVHAKQDDIAIVCGVSRQLVGRWERGTAVPDLIQATCLARYTNQPLEWFTEALIIDITDGSDVPTRHSNWNYVYRPGEPPLPFPDDDSVVIDLTDRAMAQIAQKVSDDLLAATG